MIPLAARVSGNLVWFDEGRVRPEQPPPKRRKFTPLGLAGLPEKRYITCNL
jgi:hypothetical protein